MNKILKRILWILGSLVGLIVILGLVYIFNFIAMTKHMNTSQTGLITGNVYAIKDSFVNMFLIKNGGKYIAIDGANSTKNVSRELVKLGINADSVDYVFLTHTDGDHVAAIKLFKNAKVYLSRPEEQLINGKRTRFILNGNKIATKNYELLDDQQILNIGNIKIQGILTPGHTVGSMCYIVDDKYLFVGDALRLKDGKIAPFKKFINMDWREALRSMDKVADLPGIEYIFTAHYGFTSDYKNAVKNWK